jgi:hypothetical protein
MKPAAGLEITGMNTPRDNFPDESNRNPLNDVAGDFSVSAVVAAGTWTTTTTFV